MEEKVWLSNKKWASNQIRSNANVTLIVLWVFALFWNAVTIPIWLQLSDILDKAEREPLTYIVFLFPLAGLYIVVLAINASREKLSFGHTPLAMDPFPGSIGGHIGGRIETKIPYTGQTRGQITLQCVYSYQTGSGKDRRRTESIKWQNTGICHLDNSARGTVFKFRFNTPDDLPESNTDKRRSDYYFWRISLEVKEDTAGDLRRNFVVPVFNTATSSTSIHQSTETNHETLEAAQRGIESVAEIRSIEGGVEAWYPPFQRPGLGLSMTTIGLVFIVIGVIMGINQTPLLFSIAFALVGSVLELAGIHYLVKALLVSVTPEGVRAQRFLLGYPISTKWLAAEDFACFEIKQTGTMQSGTTTKIFYNLLAKSQNGKTFTVAERHTSRPEIELIRDKFETAIT